MKQGKFGVCLEVFFFPQPRTFNPAQKAASSALFFENKAIIDVVFRCRLDYLHIFALGSSTAEPTFVCGFRLLCRALGILPPPFLGPLPYSFLEIPVITGVSEGFRCPGSNPIPAKYAVNAENLHPSTLFLSPNLRMHFSPYCPA